MLRHNLSSISSPDAGHSFCPVWLGFFVKMFVAFTILSFNQGCGRDKNTTSQQKESATNNHSSSDIARFLDHLPTAEKQEQETRDWNRAALTLYTQMAEAGNPVAQYQLGSYYAGRMSKCYRLSMVDIHQKRKSDLPLALKWFGMAAEQGMPEAKRELGLLYLGDKGVLADPSKARECLLSGAEAGDAEAQFQLGLYYEEGKGGATNFVEAIKWFQKWTFSRPGSLIGPDKYLWGYQLESTGVVRVANVPDSDMLVLAKSGDTKAQYHWAQRLAYNTGDERSAREWFSKSAHNGYAPAQYELASLYEEDVDNGCKNQSENQKQQAPDEESKSHKDEQTSSGTHNLEVVKSEAIKWYMQAAEQGWVRAQVALGRAFKWGELTSLDPVQAAKWFEIAATNGHGRAQVELAEMLYGGIWIKKDYEKAFTWFRAAADQGISDAQYKVGLMFEYGEGTTVDYSEARKWYRQAALRLHPAASAALARMYYRGKGGPRDISAARQWFLLSASDSFQSYVVSKYLDLMLRNDGCVTLGDIEITKASGNLPQKEDPLCAFGLEFISGTDLLHRDQEEGILWLKQAAELGSLKAQNLLGYGYSSGCGVEKDDTEAAKWYRMAAEQGDASAQSTLGLFYETGKGGELNPSEATKWYRRAAEKGDVLAQGNLGCCYSKGQGVPQDYTEAAKWFRKAADKGEATAQYNLGVCYYKGQGVIKDFQSAYGWFLLASAGSMTPATKMLSQVEGKISPSEQRAAREWAQNWRPSQKQLKAESKDKADSNSVAKWTSSGSGFFISDKGYFITANHVVAGASKIVLNTMAGAVDATVVASDSANDVAVLKVKDSKSRSFTALVIPPRSKVLLGQTVFTVGFPNPTLQGINPKLTKGEISALTGIQDDVRAYQVSLPVQPGNSGGVLADEHANVLGIVVQKLNTLGVALVTGDVPQNVNYALKVSYANSLIDSVPGLLESLPQPSGEALSFEKAVQKVQAASALVLSFGQSQDQ